MEEKDRKEKETQRKGKKWVKDYVGNAETKEM